MEGGRWWHVAVLGTAVVLSALILWTEPSPAEVAGGLGANVAFVLGWFLVGRHAATSARAANAFIVITIVVAAVGAAFSPAMATIQCIGYPIVWVMSRRTTQAVFATIALATGVGIGLYVSTGDLLQAILIGAVSASFSLALGLWISSIAARGTEHGRLLDELRSAQDRLAALNRDAGVASERERLAREIHDTIAQDLTGLVLLTQRARRELDSGSVAAVGEQLALLEENARVALAETRALVASTAPVGLATGGIVEALERLGARFGRETGIDVTVGADGLPVLDRDAEVVLLRCAQEGLANVRKHSGAGQAIITVSAAEGFVSLEVRDDGHGFDPGTPSAGFGLAGMRDRLALVGGELDVTSSPAGTVLTAALPIDTTAVLEATT